jgi:hypothetical protein
MTTLPESADVGRRVRNMRDKHSGRDAVGDLRDRITRIVAGFFASLGDADIPGRTSPRGGRSKQ